MLNKKIERPGREVKIDDCITKNKNVTVKIGTTDNKNHPDTVYISVSFWVDIKNKKHLETNVFNFDSYISKLFTKEIKKIKNENLKDKLASNKYFPFYYDNILTSDFPENLNYNKKRSFVNIELTLHTLNSILPIEKKIPLKNKENSEIFNELLYITKEICKSDLLKSKLDFKIYKKKK